MLGQVVAKVGELGQVVRSSFPFAQNPSAKMRVEAVEVIGTRVGLERFMDGSENFDVRCRSHEIPS